MEKHIIIFGFLTLRVCTIILTFGFFNLAWSTVLVNVLDYRTSHAVAFSLCMISAAIILIVWTLALIAAIKATYIILLASSILWSIFVILWVIVIAIAYVRNKSMLLIRQRGPESLWLVYNSYIRTDFEVDYEYYYHTEHRPEDINTCMSRLNSAEETVDSAHVDGPHARASIKTNDIMMMKWLMIIINFIIFACLIFGSLYVLYHFCDELNREETCRCNIKNDIYTIRNEASNA